MCTLRLKLLGHSLRLQQLYGPNSSALYLEFVEEISDAFWRVKANESTVLWETSTHTLERMLGYRGVWSTDMVMLTLVITEGSCCNCVVPTNCAVCIMKTFFQHRDVKTYTRWRDSLGQQSLIDFFIFSVLDVRVKKGAELSTDNQGRRQRGGQWCPGPPFEIGAPPFHVWPLGCYIHPILYFKNVAPPSGFWPPCC